VAFSNKAAALSPKLPSGEVVIEALSLVKSKVIAPGPATELALPFFTNSIVSLSQTMVPSVDFKTSSIEVLELLYVILFQSSFKLSF
jgi:hypothetical protein